MHFFIQKVKFKNFLPVIIGIVLILPYSMSAQNYTLKGKAKGNEKRKMTIPQTYSPKKATLYSIIPGLGQAYTRKYWKIPIIYTGFGVIGYFVVTNNREYKIYRDAYNCSVINGANCTNPIAKKYNSATLRLIRDYYRRNLQLSYIVMGSWYLLQILDANVNAQLSHWNVSNNITLDVYPVMKPSPSPDRTFYKGIGLRFNF